jgi:membrane fusion protein (multidrug efflux system)
MTHESTDDAFITADIVPIAPKVEGQLISVYVEDNQKVRQGDPLVRIDPRDYEVKVERVKAALSQAQATLQMTSSDVERYKSLANSNTTMPNPPSKRPPPRPSSRKPNSSRRS